MVASSKIRSDHAPFGLPVKVEKSCSGLSVPVTATFPVSDVTNVVAASLKVAE